MWVGPLPVIASAAIHLQRPKSRTPISCDSTQKWCVLRVEWQARTAGCVVVWCHSSCMRPASHFMQSLNKRSKLLNFINARMRVTIQDSRVLVGTFMAFDKHMNLVLGDCEEHRRIKARKATGGGGEGQAHRPAAPHRAASAAAPRPHACPMLCAMVCSGGPRREAHARPRAAARRECGVHPD